MTTTRTTCTTCAADARTAVHGLPYCFPCARDLYPPVYIGQARAERRYDDEGYRCTCHDGCRRCER